MLGANTITKNREEGKCVYSGYRIAFDRKGECNFGHGFANGAIIFGVDNSSSSYANTKILYTYHKNNFLALGEGDTFDINGGFGAPGLVIIIVKQIKIFASVYITMTIIDICLLMEKISVYLSVLK